MTILSPATSQSPGPLPLLQCSSVASSMNNKLTIARAVATVQTSYSQPRIRTTMRHALWGIMLKLLTKRNTRKGSRSRSPTVRNVVQVLMIVLRRQDSHVGHGHLLGDRDRTRLRSRAYGRSDLSDGSEHIGDGSETLTAVSELAEDCIFSANSEATVEPDRGFSASQ